MPKRFTSYRDSLLQRLQDAEEAEGYLEAVCEEGSPELILLALRDVAEARQMSKVASDSGLSRESIYRILSKKGNPTLTTFVSILKSLDLEVKIVNAKHRMPQSSFANVSTIGSADYFAATFGIASGSASLVSNPSGVAASGISAFVGNATASGYWSELRSWSANLSSAVLEDCHA